MTSAPGAARLRGRLPLVLYAALAVYFCFPLLAHPSRLGIADWDYFFLQQAIVVKSLFTYHQLPFWNPWTCGGNVLWQNPQLPLLNPVYLIAPLLSLPIALKANLMAHYVLGFIGMHLLVTRRFSVTSLPVAIFVASMFVCAGGIALHVAAGHMAFLTYFYLPLQLYLYLQAISTGSWRTVAVAGALVALGVVNGGIYIAALSAVAFGTFAVVLAAATRSWRPLVVLALLGLFATLFSAPKLLPSAAFLRDSYFFDSRNPFLATPMSVALLFRTLTDPLAGLSTMVPGQTYGWHEYGNHLGTFGVVLLAASVVWAMTDKPWRPEKALGVALAVTTLALMTLTIGEVSTYAPAQLLEALPLFSALRPPSRFTLVFTLFAASSVAYAMGTAIETVSMTPSVRRLGTMIVLAATLLLVVQNRRILEAAFPVPAPTAVSAIAIRPGENPVLDLNTDPYAPNSPMYTAFMGGRAIWNCYEPLMVKRVARPDRPLVYASAEARIHRATFSPNLVRFSVTATGRGGRVYLNQNFATGWTSDAGPVAIDPTTGQPYVTIDPSRPGSYSFRFFPPGLWAGCVLFVFGVALSFVLRHRQFVARRA